MGLAGHEYPDDTAFNHRRFVAGMVYSSEPGIYITRVGGFRHSDTVIVGRDRSEPVTNFTRRLDDLTVA